MDARPSPLQATIVRPEQALRITPFGLDMKVLLIHEVKPAGQIVGELVAEARQIISQSLAGLTATKAGRGDF